MSAQPLSGDEAEFYAKHGHLPHTSDESNSLRYSEGRTESAFASKVAARHGSKIRHVAGCPDHHWRAIVALCRYGGLRCPSEVLSLKWSGIYWDSDRMRVYSPKTEHHPGKDSRVVPICPELRTALDEADALAPPGSVYVVDERFRRGTGTGKGWRNCNLRTTFEKIVERAGLTKWPRLFHNLRSSRQTEWSEEFPAKVVCSWMGNSESIADRHYNQVLESHFDRATKAAQSAAQTAAADPSRRETTPSRNSVLSDEVAECLS